MSSNDKNNKKPKPLFGKPAPMPAPKKMMDEHVEETTRRVGGRGAPAPSMVAPSMGPMPVPFGLSGASTMPMPGFGASINTAPMKAPQAAVAAPTKPKFVWSLPQVPTLPEFHPLERTAVFVPHTQPSVVTKRISDVLRDRSIEAFYDNDKAKARCITTDGVDFRVRLYRGRNQYSHGIIVEVQRRFGTSISFHSDTIAILDAAEGKEPLPPPPSMDVLPMVVSDDEEDDDDYDSAPSGSSSLDMVAKMLSLPGYDAQYLGLQTLSSLVDAAKMGSATARTVSRGLLQPDSVVGQKVFTFVSNRKTDEDPALGLRVMSLGILSNAIKSSGSFPEFVRRPLRSVLLQDLRDAESQPRTALMAAKCLEHFIQGDDDTMELNEAFERALEVGQSRHAGLMRQAERCISKIR